MFNLVFFLVLPFLLLLKLCKKIIKCCRKDSDTKKEETEKQDESEENEKVNGPDVDIFKDGDIMKDGSPRAQSSHSVKLLGEHGEIPQGSKENMAITKRNRANSKSKHGSGDNIAASRSGHEIKRKMSDPGSRRGSKAEPTEEPSTSRRTSEGKVQETASSHSYDNVAGEKTEPSKPQVRNEI